MRTYQEELATFQKPVEDEDFSYALLSLLLDTWNTFISFVPDNILKNPSKLIARILSGVTRLHEHSTSQTTGSAALPAVNKANAKCYKCGKKGHFASEHQDRDQKNKNTSDSHKGGKEWNQDRKHGKSY
jgi:hypothetical protein